MVMPSLMLSTSLTVAGPVFLMPRSRFVTLVVTDEPSSNGVLLGGPMAVLVTVPVAMALTVMTFLIESPSDPLGARVPTLQVIFFVVVSKVQGESTLWNTKRLGITSVQVALGI